MRVPVERPVAAGSRPAKSFRTISHALALSTTRMSAAASSGHADLGQAERGAEPARGRASCAVVAFRWRCAAAASTDGRAHRWVAARPRRRSSRSRRSARRPGRRPRRAARRPPRPRGSGAVGAVQDAPVQLDRRAVADAARPSSFDMFTEASARPSLLSSTIAGQLAGRHDVGVVVQADDRDGVHLAQPGRAVRLRGRERHRVPARSGTASGRCPRTAPPRSSRFRTAGYRRRGAASPGTSRS